MVLVGVSIGCLMGCFPAPPPWLRTAPLKRPWVDCVALGNLQKCVGGFLLYKFWRIFPGIFLEDFSGHFFPQKMRRKNPARKSAKKFGGPKIKIREKSVLPKAGPKLWHCRGFFALSFCPRFGGIIRALALEKSLLWFLHVVFQGSRLFGDLQSHPSRTYRAGPDPS